MRLRASELEPRTVTKRLSLSSNVFKRLPLRGLGPRNVTRRLSLSRDVFKRLPLSDLGPRNVIMRPRIRHEGLMGRCDGPEPVHAVELFELRRRLEW